MARLWQRLGEVYGSAWINQYGKVGESAFNTWCTALADLTEQDIRAGFARLLKRESRWAPNLNEFRALCMPDLADLGLPDLRAAYTEACLNSRNPNRASWSHPGVFVAGRASGWFELSQFPERQSFPIFERNYQIVTRRVMAGESLNDELPRALPPKSKVKQLVPREEAKRRMQSLKSMVAGGSS